MTAVTDQIEALATACTTLIGPTPDPLRMSHMGLHPRNAHPATRAVYEGALNPPALPVRLRARFEGLLRRVALPVRAFARSEPLWFGDPLPQHADVLFISHFTNPKQINVAQDAYFGELPQLLADRQLRSVTACLNHTWLGPKDIPPRPTCVGARVILSRTLAPLDELHLAHQLAQDIDQMSKERTKDTVTRTLLAHLRRTHPDSASLTALRIARQIKALVQHLRPRALMFTFEGHPWERLAMQAARAVDPHILCLAYHHTVLFPEQMALASAYGPVFDPNAILTTGSVTADWFATQPDWHKTPVIALGSARAPNHPHPRPRDIGPQGAQCLVIPEGLLSETVFLIRHAIEAAQLDPKLRFCVRLHPVLSRAQVLRAAPELKSLPPNMHWSEASLNADLAAASHVLYRGSTLAITAVLNGLQPLYVCMPDEPFSVDPLAALSQWHSRIETSAQLVDHLRADTARAPKSRHLAYTVAADYCSSYFQPLRPEPVIDLIEAKRGIAR